MIWMWKRILFWGLALVVLSAHGVVAAEKIVIKVNNRTISAYRLADFEQAKKEAKESKKHIAWIASSPKVLENNGSITGTSGRAATSHAFAAMGDRAVLVFQDAFAENHQGPAIVDEALHTPNPHYTPPSVVILDAELSRVVGVILYEPDFERRKEAFKNAILQMGKPQ